MKRTLKVFIAGAAVVALAAAGAAAVRGKLAEQGAAASAAPVAEFLQDDLFIVEPRTLERTLPLTGSLAPLNEATVKAKVVGELVAVTVREGESVTQGQVLARIDLTEVQARVAARQADVQAARAQLVWAEKNRGQQKALLDKAFISQSAFDNIQSNYDVAVARLRAADAELVVARKSLGDAVLLAPFSGIVSLRHAQPGERAALDAKVVSIVETDEPAFLAGRLVCTAGAAVSFGLVSQPSRITTTNGYQIQPCRHRNRSPGAMGKFARLCRQRRSDQGKILLPVHVPLPQRQTAHGTCA